MTTGQTDKRFYTTDGQTRKSVCPSVSSLAPYHPLRCNPVTLFLCSFVTLLLCSCGADSQHFRLKGKFQNLNQGEFYIYNTQGLLNKIDTIRVDRGRFTYQAPCTAPATFMLVFPNFTEQPIFAEPGNDVEVKGDVSNLREMEIIGNKDNALLTAFRRQNINLSPQDEARNAEQFVKEHPESQASIYIIEKYFLKAPTPDYKKAETLLTAIAGRQDKSLQLAILQQKVKTLKHTANGQPIPSFKAYDLQGKPLSDAVLKGSGMAVVTTCATWNYDSMDMLRQLRRLQKRSHGKLKVLPILLDANKQDFKRSIERDSISWPVAFDNAFFDSNIVRAFGLTAIGDNILYHDGRVVTHSLSKTDLIKEIEKRL